MHYSFKSSHFHCTPRYYIFSNCVLILNEPDLIAQSILSKDAIKLQMLLFSSNKAILRVPKKPATKVAVIMVITFCNCVNLFDSPFISQIREYPHESFIININIVQNERMVNPAKFLDEFLHRGLFSLIFPVYHNDIDYRIL